MSEMHFMSEISDLGHPGGGITQIQGVQCARPNVEVTTLDWLDLSDL